MAASGWQLNKLNNRRYVEEVEVLLSKLRVAFKTQYRIPDLNSWKYVIWMLKIPRADNFRMCFQNQCEDCLFFSQVIGNATFNFQICSAPTTGRLFNICQILQSTFKYKEKKLNVGVVNHQWLNMPQNVGGVQAQRNCLCAICKIACLQSCVVVWGCFFFF